MKIHPASNSVEFTMAELARVQAVLQATVKDLWDTPMMSGTALRLIEGIEPILHIDPRPRGRAE